MYALEAKLRVFDGQPWRLSRPEEEFGRDQVQGHGRPFYQLWKDGVVVCSERGEVLVRSSESPGPPRPMKCRITGMEFYPYQSTEEDRDVIRCSSCAQVICEPNVQ